MANLNRYFDNYKVYDVFYNQWDYNLSDDERYANTIIDVDPLNQKDLGVYIDINNQNSFSGGNNLYSLNAWDKAKYSGFTISDINLTDIDLGVVNSLTGGTIGFTSPKLIFREIFPNNTGNTFNIRYDYSGKYLKLNGNYFNSYYKLDGYDLELLPNRYEKGFTITTLLKLNHNTKNYDLSGNTGFFFYWGARAENKYHNVFDGELGYTTTTGIPLQPGVDYFTNTNINFYQASGDTNEDIIQTNPSVDEVIGFRITSDYRIGYRAIRTSGSCSTTGTTLTNNKSIDYATQYNGITTYYIEEKYSTESFFSGGVNTLCSECNNYVDSSDWVMITIKFDYHKLSDCFLETEPNRKGTLTIFVNGRPFLVVKDFEEIIPKRLETHKDKQQGVPYNFFWGGGSPGLSQTQTFNGPDNNDKNLLIEETFNGTLDLGISKLYIHTKPLDITEIRWLFEYDRCRYGLRGNFGGRKILLPNNC